ncbi:GNAT family N-acetyltransferase [Aquimarina sp. U1-2]|uniref:GNAT family N-acetyltransferase n=1 Tax=Aquimarina sp. U1-2 TaxID=2823141 RepID=UPI001AEC7FF0|nr:GNAT family N-acetyltransferase [Aquimarina sp. U1-2]MBP2831007.1 GNAT family N-acetyltransferase [Aquimarina sp. U1-2]
MIRIEEIRKKDIPTFFNDSFFWNQSFLAITKHRLHAHLHNPNCDNNDIVLLLAFLNEELVGYMGLFTDIIQLEGKSDKIGWLSTWWVHPKTKGTGVGRKILETMYELNNGKIGISQFTESARRVYDKSGYFVSLKESNGIKAVLRSNLVFVIPTLYPKTTSLKSVLLNVDRLINVFVNLKLALQKRSVQKKLRNISLEYLSIPDAEVSNIIASNNSGHISNKTSDFFEWLKKCPWVLEAPLLQYTEKNKYAFSMYDNSFSYYYIKIIKNQVPIAFVVLQVRNSTLKVLFAYYAKSTENAQMVSDVIKLHAITQNIREVICYDEGVVGQFKESNLFLYRRKKIKSSIISKVYKKTDFDDVVMNFGDGDCCFA